MMQAVDHAEAGVSLGVALLRFSPTRQEWWLARWDADAYLKKSFSHLHSRLRPDLVVFLGDTFSNAWV